MILALLGIAFNYSFRKFNFNSDRKVGEKIDSLNGVYVFYNGGVGHSGERNKTADGYNIGIRYQCVEFVKRYFYEVYQHKMLDAYGNAKDFFNSKYADGEKNLERDLLQYSNPSSTKPQTGDLLIYSPTVWNRYGHVAIVSVVDHNTVEIIQQNAGPFSPTREKFGLKNTNGQWQIDNSRILGWLRKEISVQDSLVQQNNSSVDI